MHARPARRGRRPAADRRGRPRGRRRARRHRRGVRGRTRLSARGVPARGGHGRRRDDHVPVARLALRPASGACLTAGEDTQTFPVSISDGEVHVGLAVEFGPGERGLRADALTSAVEAGDERRAARNVARLLAAGAGAPEISRLLARYAASHGPGLGLGGGAVADALALAGKAPEQTELLLAQAASIVAALDGRGAPRFPAEPSSRFADERAGGVAEAIGARVAARDADGAEAIVAGQLERGVEPASIALLLAAAASSGFRGARALVLVERAARLAELDRDVARLALPGAARISRRHRCSIASLPTPVACSRTRRSSASRATSATRSERSRSSARRGRPATRRCSASPRRSRSCRRPPGAAICAPARMRPGSPPTRAPGAAIRPSPTRSHRPISSPGQPTPASPRRARRSSSRHHRGARARRAGGARRRDAARRDPAPRALRLALARRCAPP